MIFLTLTIVFVGGYIYQLIITVGFIIHIGIGIYQNLKALLGTYTSRSMGIACIYQRGNIDVLEISHLQRYDHFLRISYLKFQIQAIFCSKVLPLSLGYTHIGTKEGFLHFTDTSSKNNSSSVVCSYINLSTHKQFFKGLTKIPQRWNLQDVSRWHAVP